MTFSGSVDGFVQTLLFAVIAGAIVSCGSSTSTTPITLAFDPAYPPPTSLSTGASAGIGVIVSNDPGTANVSWSCTPANQCGTFTPATIHSTVPTCYLAPGEVPAGGSVTVTATSVTNPTKSISASITVVSGAPQPCS